ncbi:MAG TPA: ABC transporter permease [Jatrophihabitantaceae bacterium]|jgi:teichoic acid transport system permease protein|nr:ABC transporter permease [Jatrophihabitantaceae bacterium]
MTEPTSAPPAPGLQRAGARLPIDEYSRRLWERRWFVAAYSTASNSVGYQGSFLGQAWQLLTPLLNIAVYYLIFGMLLHTNRGVPNFIAFLSVGVFVFSFCTDSLTAGARSITGNIGLVRALQFPRAVLPVSTTLVALLRLLYSLIVLIPIVLITGEPLTWRWLELVPALVLQSMFCLGIAFVVARIGAQVPDTTQALPFVARVWTYTAGVMYSVQTFAAGHGQWVSVLLTVNPGHVYLAIARNALLADNPCGIGTWLLAIAWSVGTLAVSYLYFWRGEEAYGNV